MELQELLELIDRAATEQWKELNLAGMNLTELPPEIGKLTQLEKLKLGDWVDGKYIGNSLTDLPAEIGKLTNLTGLDLSSNQIATIPEVIGNLTNLTWLYLHNNQIATIPEVIGNLTNLIILGLNNNQIATIPEVIGNLTNLIILGLNNNQIATIPEVIGNLTNLAWLYLHSNQITTIPEVIGKLTNLTELDLSSNQIAIIPEVIGKLTNLTELSLHSNQITTIPEVIGNLTNLTKLYLWGNQIAIIPEVIGKLTNLTVLYLSSNQITTIPEVIGNLTNLTWLNLHSNQITTIPEVIGNLTNLTKLYLWGNQIAIIPEVIGNLTNLTVLYLSSNQITTIPEVIGNLTNLTLLELGSNQIATIPEVIGKLTNLTELSLHSNQITTIPEVIGKLTNLTKLYLWGNQIAIIPEVIGKLTNLTLLELGSNQIATIPEVIGKLTNLTELYLNSNQITIIPEVIGNLTNLTKLYLWGNQIATIPEVIGKLTNLTELALHNNQIATIPEVIVNLTNLTELYLWGNQIATIPEVIGKLTNLTWLNLKSNQITIIPEVIGKLTNLTWLNLGSNQIATIPEVIGKLTNLTLLSLHSNQITTIPEVIGKLTNLTELYLYSNQITIIPEWFQSFNHLEKLDLRGNPIPIPIEILGPKDLSKDPGDLRSILKFYFQTQDPQATDTFYEAKFIIVGEGESGKTTLAKKIQDSDYQLDIHQKSTEGIDIIRWEFQHNGKPFRVNIWDFGGQEIYHATHQFFLTERSLYTLLIDNRRDSPNSEYWLNIIRLLSGDSPVFITKNEKQDRQCELDEGELRHKFLQLQPSIPTNFATNRGVSDIHKAIQQHITSLSHIHIPIPKTWIRVRNTLENYAQNQNHISAWTYRTICRQNGVTDAEDMRTLGKYLHDLGICLYFQQNPTLKHLVILNPSWATNAVYKVTDSKLVIDNKGRFTTKDLNTIWSDAQYAELQHELLELMKNFSICYPVRNLPDTYIAPSRISAQRPEYKWNIAESLTFRYTYTFMPKGILTRFIVEMHDKIDQLPPSAPPSSQLVWKTGVILADGSARAEVIEDYHSRRIRIRVVGFGKKTLLENIRHEFQKIHNSYDGLKYQELIPCNCPQCKDVEKPHTYSYESLLRRLENNRFDVECEKSYLLVNIRRTIDETIEPTPNINLSSSKVRQLIDEAITDSQLSDLCFDNFPQVYREFDGKTRSQKIRDLVEYADRQGETSKLLRSIEQLNPHTSARFSGKTRPTDFHNNLDERGRFPQPPPPPTIINIHNHNGANNMTGDTNFISHGSGDNIGGDKVMGDKINTQINNSQNLTQAAADIKTLLNQFSEEYNPNTPTGQSKISTAAIEQIQQNPTLKDRVVKAIKEGGAEALKEAIDHPAVTVFIAAFKGFAEGK
jgi:Leucine-rich repeat (LRR) protein/GTPase SAR1 family protein